MKRYKWNEWITSLTAFLKHRVYLTLSPTLLLALHVPAKDKQYELKHKTYGEDGQCVFCKLANTSESLIYEDDLLAAFLDRKPLGKDYIQVVPKFHIKNINDLNESHIALIERMWEIGLRLLKERKPGEQYYFGFHVPPRNSIDHLHLHCIVLPIKNLCDRLSHNNWLWLMSPKDVIAKLKNERHIRSNINARLL
ncbi:unnamed protein product [Blepharisma stoltei]|uniref:HIT domain-containing protein n=1 Tax=Blepharisma stoltei TaxID=1481888 RepID=A0AAU9KF00_9CILI|nr:unnamed protein product [Blepharisma stoltei]